MNLLELEIMKLKSSENYDAKLKEIEFYKNFPQIKTITSHSIMYRKSKG